MIQVLLAIYGYQKDMNCAIRAMRRSSARADSGQNFTSSRIREERHRGKRPYLLAGPLAPFGLRRRHLR